MDLTIDEINLIIDCMQLKMEQTDDQEYLRRMLVLSDKLLEALTNEHIRTR